MKKVTGNFLTGLVVVMVIPILIAGIAWSQWAGPHTPTQAITKAGFAPIIMKMITDLCDISGYGIYSGIHPGPKQDRAAAYILSKLKDPRLNARLEPCIVKNPWPNNWELTLLGSNSREIFSHPMGFTAGTPAQGIQADLVYVGEGTAGHFKNVDVNGKIALIDNKYILNFLASDVFTGSASRAFSNGAIGIIFADLVVDAPKWRNIGSGTNIFPIPVFSIGKSEGNYLRTLATSGVATVRMKLDVPHADVPSSTVVAELKGNGSIDEIILVLCHYDSTWTGALDSNSSVATVIGLANYFAAKDIHSRNRDMWFVFTVGHDAGYMQAVQFVSDHQDIMAKTIVYDVDHPLAGTGERQINNEIIPTGKDSIRSIWTTSGELASLASFSLERYGLTPAMLGVRIPQGGANSGSFVSAGCPSLCAMIAGPWYYHTIFDTPDKLSLDEIERSFPANIEILENIDRTPEGYILYSDINTKRNVPTTTPKVGFSVLKSTVFVGDPVIAWADYLDYDRVVHSFPQLPDFAGIMWNWGDGTPAAKSSALTYATHVYANPGTYVVTMELTDVKGIKGNATMSITVVPLP